MHSSNLESVFRDVMVALLSDLIQRTLVTLCLRPTLRAGYGLILEEQERFLINFNHETKRPHVAIVFGQIPCMFLSC